MTNAILFAKIENSRVPANGSAKLITVPWTGMIDVKDAEVRQVMVLRRVPEQAAACRSRKAIHRSGRAQGKAPDARIVDGLSDRPYSLTVHIQGKKQAVSRRAPIETPAPGIGH
ncbi:MAG: hypothetical protein GX608_08070 [Lentisphaerae bacterium]|nr:hypothetical protein [Lentisphaerota bacterium]